MRSLAKWIIWWLVSTIGATVGVLLGFIVAEIVHPLISFLSFFLIAFFGGLGLIVFGLVGLREMTPQASWRVLISTIGALSGSLAGARSIHCKGPLPSANSSKKPAQPA